LPQSPTGHPAAKQCFAWDAREPMTYKLGDNGENMVLDVEIPSDAKDLPRMAVWAWLTGTRVKEKEADYVESEKWQRDDLHGKPVEFYFDNKIKSGNFFARRRADGKISVRIVYKVQIKFDGIDEEKLDSLCLTQNQIENISSPANDSWSFRLIL
jgi:hypothetical protein